MHRKLHGTLCGLEISISNRNNLWYTCFNYHRKKRMGEELYVMVYSMFDEITELWFFDRSHLKAFKHQVKVIFGMHVSSVYIQIPFKQRFLQVTEILFTLCWILTNLIRALFFIRCEYLFHWYNDGTYSLFLCVFLGLTPFVKMMIIKKMRWKRVKLK